MFTDTLGGKSHGNWGQWNYAFILSKRAFCFKNKCVVSKFGQCVVVTYGGKQKLWSGDWPLTMDALTVFMNMKSFVVPCDGPNGLLAYLQTPEIQAHIKDRPGPCDLSSLHAKTEQLRPFLTKHCNNLKKKLASSPTA